MNEAIVKLPKLKGSPMENVKVSIIVPVYNSHQYLDRMFQSLFEQTWGNIEVITISDGAEERCISICRKWAKQDERIIFYEREHEGQGSQRNFGIETATGKYIMFLDSDDYLDADAVEVLVRYMELKNADLCLFSEKNILGKGEVYIHQLKSSIAGVLSVDECVEIMGLLRPSLWSKCYSAKLLKESGVSMVNSLCEDLLYLSEIVPRAKRICALDKALYNYRVFRINNLSMAIEGYKNIVSTVNLLNQNYVNNKKWDKYWKQLFLICIYMLGERLMRIRYSDECVQPEIKHGYAELKKEYIEVLEKWFSGNLCVGVVDGRFCVDGSNELNKIVKSLSVEGIAPFKSVDDTIDIIAIDFLDIAEEILKGIDYKTKFETRIDSCKKAAEHRVSIVIVENYLVKKFGTYIDDVESFSNHKKIDTVNSQLSKLYEQAENELKEAYVVKNDGYDHLKYSYNRGQNGCAPYIYNPVYVSNFALEIAICLKDRFRPKEQDADAFQPRVNEDRFRVGFNLFDLWLKRYEDGRSIIAFFIDNEIKSVAIYGLGALGKHLLKQLHQEGVEVVYAIDRMAGELKDSGIKVLSSDSESFPGADVIIVTPIQDYWSIVSILETKTKVPIVSLEDVISY